MKKQGSRISSLVFVAATVGIAPVHAQGLQGTYHAHANAGAFIFTPAGKFTSEANSANQTQSSPVTVAAAYSAGANQFQGQAQVGTVASADAGVLDMSATMTASNADDATRNRNSAMGLGFTQANASYTDFVITSLAQSDATTVTARVNGTLVSQNNLTNGTNSNIFLEAVETNVTVAGTQVFNGTGTQSFTSSTLTLPVGTPFTLSMSMKWGTQVLLAGRRITSDSATLQFHASLSLGAAVSGANFAGWEGPITNAGGTRPVFDLPTGFTVNSVQANVFNNSWLGPTLSVAVPEPGTLSLLALAPILGIGFARRRMGRGGE